MFNSESTTTPGFGPPSTTAATDTLVSPTAAVDYPFRLLADEVVLGTYPITRKRRPLGSLVSYLFVTDSRVVYSAEGKTFCSSSIQTKEYQVPKIEGIEIGRHRGLNALGVAVSIGVVLNFLGMVMLAVLAGTSNYVPEEFGLGGAFLAMASLVVGILVIAILRRSTATLKVVGPQNSQTLANETDLLKLFMMILLFLIFGVFIGFTVVLWALVRELGVFKADDAQSFADADNIDRIAHEVGGLILDVQARGKLAGRD